MKTIHHLLLSILSGFLLGLSWPTDGFPLILFFGFIPLLLVEHSIAENEKLKKKGVKIFLFAYTSFVIWNLLAVGWLYNLQPAFPAFPIAIAFNSLFMAIVFWLFYYFKTVLGSDYGYIFLPLIWITFEKVHLNWSLSFPWLNLGNGFAEYHTWIQWYEYTGVSGGTLWIWIVNLGLFFAIKQYFKTKKIEKLLQRIIIQVFIIIIPVFASLLMYNFYEENGDEVKIAVLQPNLDVYEEKYRISKDQMTDDIIRLATSGIEEDTDYILAPETSILGIRGINIDRVNDNAQIEKINKFVEKHPNTLFIGGTSFHKLIFDESQKTSYSNKITNADSEIWVDQYNSAFQISSKTDSIQTYHKSKLVIGVETIPFHSFLKPFMEKVLIDLGGTVSTHAPQKERTNFENTINNFRPGVAICYESIYGEFVTEYVKKGADLLFIITNDGWWGDSQGHKQHLAYAKLRAIENRRSIARSANTGESAFINQKGDIISSLEYGEKGSLNNIITTNNKLTFYSKYGDLIGRTVLLLTGMFFAILISKIMLLKNKIGI